VTTSTKNIPNLKGKVLDFANVEKAQVESALFYSGSSQKKQGGAVPLNTYESG